MSDGEIVFVSVMVAAGVGCLVVAAVMWWNRVKAKYDPVFVSVVLEEGRVSVLGELIVVDDPVKGFELNEKALRRMMKQTSAEMEETGEWWGYRWSK